MITTTGYVDHNPDCETHRIWQAAYVPCAAEFDYSGLFTGDLAVELRRRGGQFQTPAFFTIGNVIGGLDADGREAELALLIDGVVTQIRVKAPYPALPPSITARAFAEMVSATADRILAAAAELAA